ncbi:probable glutathione S-transferase [Malania oleifera]|uniref:probable glutathione S-transferase n=1 Tax=Malania oleifera TaxID=397392 RepID=UPI0025AEC39F|nr:probable glutathione S-transferase [Malania oleifera]
MADEVVVLDFWGSPFVMRVRIALAEKGIEYESKEEDLSNKKSPLLLKMNPVHKTVPVLIHNGNPVCESAIIVRYIEEVWKDKYPLLPSDPYQRSQAIFWADFVDKKIFGTGRRMWLATGEEEREAAAAELIEWFKQLEGELGEKAHFGGEVFGYVDVTLIPFYSWFYTYETFGKFAMSEQCPKLVAWAERCLQRESVSRSLPDGHRVYDFVLQLRKKFGVA